MEGESNDASFEGQGTKQKKQKRNKKNKGQPNTESEVIEQDE